MIWGMGVGFVERVLRGTRPKKNRGLVFPIGTKGRKKDLAVRAWSAQPNREDQPVT